MILLLQIITAEYTFKTYRNRDHINFFNLNEPKTHSIILPKAVNEEVLYVKVLNFTNRLKTKIILVQDKKTKKIDKKTIIKKTQVYFNIYYMNPYIIDDLCNTLSELGNINLPYKDFYSNTQTIRFCDEIADIPLYFFYHTNNVIVRDEICEPGYFYFNNVDFAFYRIHDKKHYSVHWNINEGFRITKLNLYLNVTAKDAFLLLVATIGKQLNQTLTYESMDSKWLCIACIGFTQRVYNFA